MKFQVLTPTTLIKIFAFRLNILLQLDELSPPPPQKVEFHKAIRDFDCTSPVDLMTGNNDVRRKCI
jgi:hypothetical protein